MPPLPSPSEDAWPWPLKMKEMALASAERNRLQQELACLKEIAINQRKEVEWLENTRRQMMPVNEQYLGGELAFSHSNVQLSKVQPASSMDTTAMPFASGG